MQHHHTMAKNIELHRYRVDGLPSLDSSSMSQFVLQLLLTMALRPLGVICTPLSRILAANISIIRWFYVLGMHMIRTLLRLVGWLSGSPFSGSRRDDRIRQSKMLLFRVYRYYFGAFNLKRWHMVMGESEIPTALDVGKMTQTRILILPPIYSCCCCRRHGHRHSPSHL